MLYHYLNTAKGKRSRRKKENTAIEKKLLAILFFSFALVALSVFLTTTNKQ